MDEENLDKEPLAYPLLHGKHLLSQCTGWGGLARAVLARDPQKQGSPVSTLVLGSVINTTKGSFQPEDLFRPQQLINLLLLCREKKKKNLIHNK